jgi:hypothetical protein
MPLYDLMGPLHLEHLALQLPSTQWCVMACVDFLDLTYVQMQEAGALWTQRSCTVYLQTVREETRNAFAHSLATTGIVSFRLLADLAENPLAPYRQRRQCSAPKRPESAGQSDKWVERRLYKTERNPAGLTERRFVFGLSVGGSV